MKLRISGPSIRLRRDSREVAKLQAGEAIEASIRLGSDPDDVFRYCLQPDATVPARPLGVRYRPRDIVVTAPLTVLQEWCGGNGITLEGEENFDGYQVRILIEKDLQRLNPKPGDDTSSLFPNPRFGIDHCDHP